MAKLFSHLLMKVNQDIIAIFYVAFMSFNAIRENKILAKISEFTVEHSCVACKISKVINPYVAHVVTIGSLENIIRGMRLSTETQPRLIIIFRGMNIFDYHPLKECNIYKGPTNV